MEERLLIILGSILISSGFLGVNSADALSDSLSGREIALGENPYEEDFEDLKGKILCL